MAEFLPRLRQGVPIGTFEDEKGNRRKVYPSSDLILLWQTLVQQLELVPEIQALADQAQASADAAQASADAAAASVEASALENSIVFSFTKDPDADPMITGAPSGDVFVEGHTRQYGDPTLNPDVLIDAANVVTGAAPGETVRLFYDDPSRAGGAVTYQFTIDPASAPVQGGDRHVVGAVVIPAAGASTGAPVLPPGTTTPTP